MIPAGPEGASPALQQLTDELHASEMRYRRLFEAAKDGILILDARTGEIDAVNPFLSDLLGYAPQELIGKKLWEIGPFQDAKTSRIAFQELQSEEYIRYEDLPLQTRDGRSIAVEFVSNVYMAGDRKVIQCNIRDITARTSADRQLRLQGAALDAAANAIVITDPDGVIEWVNPAFTGVTGYTAVEAIGRNPRDLLKSGRQDRAFFQALWDTILSGQTWRGDIVNRRKDGSLYTEEQAITPVRNASGAIGHFIAIKQDVTARKRADEEIRAGARLSALSAAVGLALAGADSLPHALQRCAEAIVTHLEAALVRIWTLDDHAATLELQASAGLYTHLDGPHGRVPVGQFKIGRIARDRTPHITNEVIGDPHVDDQAWAQREGMVAFAGHPLIVDGRVNGVVALFARHALPDTVVAALASVADHLALGIERHRTAEALRTAEERMRFALHHANVGVWDMDYVTGALRWSETIEAQHGLEPGAFAGTFEAFVERIHPGDRAAVLETIGNALKSGADFRVDNRVVWPDGTVRWLTGTGRVLLDGHGDPVRGVGVSLDVTDRHALEAQYRQAQKMDALGQLAGGIAHDFNNLLTVILGYCDLLLADSHPGDSHRAGLEEIQEAGARAARLTRQLLAFSRKQLIEPTLLDLNAVVGDMRGMLRRLIGEDVTVVLNLAAVLPLVKADRGQVEQIVMNLAVNARDAMPGGGTLTIATAAIELDERYAAEHLDVTPGPHVALTVTDTGTGMTPEVLARLFEPFFTTKALDQGAGLGLATVHGVVMQSGGSVGVASEIDRGTSIHVYFPRADPGEPIADTAPSVSGRRAGGETVLVVEDMDAVRELARRLLEQQRYTVLLAANADDALRLFEEHPSVDVLLTDVVLPGGSGPDLATQLLEQRPTLKVVYMSGYTQKAIVHHGVDPRVAFLHKPFNAEMLGRKMREVLDGRAGADEVTMSRIAAPLQPVS